MRHVCVVTGTRAEYGLLRPLLSLLREQRDVALQLIVTGAHLSPEFGNTVSEIVADGFAIAERIEMLLSSDTAVGATKSLGLATLAFADSLARLKPDLLVLLGDRYEILAAAQSALLARIPIAHLHGGEITEGAVDDAIRHAVTKMASLHFAATQMSIERIWQMGEHPDTTFHVGAIGLDALAAEAALDIEALEKDLGVSLERPIAIVTLHPETRSDPDAAERQASLLVEALERFPGISLVLTGANADAGGRSINSVLERFAERRRACFRMSLGHKRYLSLLKHADLVIGNSSSGILEAHAARTVCVNIGERQRGREQPPSVVNAEWTVEAIASAIGTAMTPSHRMTLDLPSPYGTPGVAERIANVLCSVSLSEIARKRFFSPIKGEP